MHLNVQTLLVAAAIANACSLGARVLLWRMHPSTPGLGYWAFAGAAGSAGFALILANRTLTLPLLGVAQIVFVGGLVYAWIGFRLFMDRASPSRLAVLSVATVTIGSIALAQSEGSLVLRSLTGTALVSLLSARIAYELLTAAEHEQTAMRVTGWVYAANALFFMVRASVNLFGMSTSHQWNPFGSAAPSLLWWLCMTVATTLGMMLMTSESLRERLNARANCDPLTGVLNRRAFAILAAKFVERHRRENTPLSLLMIDLDRFKQVNDCFGHGAGDKILCHFVHVANHVLRGNDLLCRFGGDEFVVLLPDASAQQAAGTAERIRTAFAKSAPRCTAAGSGVSVPIAVSIGVSELQTDEDLDSALRRTDAALYRAKSMGRNQCQSADLSLPKATVASIAETAVR